MPNEGDGAELSLPKVNPFGLGEQLFHLLMSTNIEIDSNLLIYISYAYGLYMNNIIHKSSNRHYCIIIIITIGQRNQLKSLSN